MKKIIILLTLLLGIPGFIVETYAEATYSANPVEWTTDNWSEGEWIDEGVILRGPGGTGTDTGDETGEKDPDDTRNDAPLGNGILFPGLCAVIYAAIIVTRRSALLKQQNKKH